MNTPLFNGLTILAAIILSLKFPGLAIITSIIWIGYLLTRSIIGFFGRLHTNRLERRWRPS